MAMYSSKDAIPNNNMVFGTESLRWVQSYKYLGVLMNSNGELCIHQKIYGYMGGKPLLKLNLHLRI